MLTIQDLSFHFGDRIMYEEASLQIKPKDRIGLVGMNGTGKTTLLKLIYGDLVPDGGAISKSRDCTIGFLNQDLLSYESQEPIIQIAMQGFQRELQLQQQIEEALHQLETNYSEEVLHHLSELQEEFHTLGGYSMQAQAEEILEGLGFKTEDLTKPLSQFSGGWRMRVMLAKLLLQKPSVLLLDEPTNHLDLPSIQWMEEYITRYEGAIVIVSHDRYFLDRAANSIVEVSGGKLNQYAGNYSFFVEEKELRNEIQRNAFKNQQQKIKQTEQFINRFKAKATKSRQVQSRVKLLEKMDRVDDVVEDNVEMRIKFTFSQPSGKVVTTLKGIEKSYGDNLILHNTDLTIERGDKIAFIGANGMGKSTLLRIIAGTERHLGIRETGHNVIPSFYAQHQLEALNIQNEILEELKQAGSGRTELELRSLLGCFLFTDDDVFKKIKVLSGGEKSRVALAKTLISQANFLLLDEPTNHLDMQSVNILIQALQQYQGTFLVVSHDRHFISQIANKIWYVEDKQAKEYPGTYFEFVQWMEKRTQERAAGAQALPPPPKPKAEVKKGTSISNEDLKGKQKEAKKLKKEVEELEEKIGQLERDKAGLEEKMASPSVFADPFSLAETNEKYQKTSSQLDTLQEKWENLALKLEELEAFIR